ncbi:beta-lactamase/transpeptidase-like protein [Stachybotrys elegans]|uniref:Beta-lactamase/transpeptidase-like protein n=1 Tax=Stachybotrys elegans TaxID=80388 RepID=A0A8K0SBL5_9HYPO|nr:beta-lactamase/transpeptidase-like protein [Stachybotrys elegans]
MNETESHTGPNDVTSDSIFRVNSVSKNFAVFSALAVENIAKSQNVALEMTLDTPVRLLLPQFRLPEKDWNDGGRDITLRMLASHNSGITREGYSTDFNVVLGTDKANAMTIGEKWAAATPEGMIERVANTNLMYPPGKRAGYSNVGISILASAITNYYNNITESDLTWNDLMMQEILSPLNMTHTFLGSIPDELLPEIGVPGSPNWADLVIGLGYDPAAGMWSSANDLAKYLYDIWLRPDPLPLITLAQRRRLLQPDLALPDGQQLVGPGWEINLFEVPTSDGPLALNRTYAVYGKSGNGGGWRSYIDVVADLGYSLIILAQSSFDINFAPIFPTTLASVAHQYLLPAFAEAVASQVEARFAGRYGHGRDAGAIVDEVRNNGTNSTSYARIEVEEQILYLRELVINGTSALEAIDRLGWTDTYTGRYYSTPAGTALTPAESAGENDEFGPGAQVWRFSGLGQDACNWFDFDGYQDVNGWPLGKIVLVESEDGVELHYPPFDIVLSRMGTCSRH